MTDTRSMMRVPVRQYYLPDGRVRDQIIETDDADFFNNAMRVLENGMRFEAEMLTTGEVSLTVVLVEEPDDRDPTVAIEVVDNGPGVLAAFKRMTERVARKIVDGEQL